MKIHQMAALAALLGVVSALKWAPKAADMTTETKVEKPLQRGNDGVYFEAAITPLEGERLASADYRLWLPDGVAKLRCVIVRQHGCGAGAAQIGLNLVRDIQWQELARGHSGALLSTRLTAQGACSGWTDPSRGSDAAYNRSLAEFGRQTKHPEITDVPWALTGHSGGGFWTTTMTMRHPERVAVAVPARGRLLSRPSFATGEKPARKLRELDAAFGPAMQTMWASPEAKKAVQGVPILFAQGAKDDLVNGAIDPRREFYRPSDAPWTLAIDPTAGHQVAALPSLSLPYLDAMLQLRLPALAGDALRPLDVSGGYLGDPLSNQTSPRAAFEGEGEAAAWLPDENLARLWARYSQSGQAGEKADLLERKPGAVRATRRGSMVRVTWRYAVPLGADLPAFRIERDGVAIGTLAALRHGNGGDPVPADYALEWQDKGGVAKDYVVYALEGERQGLASEAARVVDVKP